VLSFPLSVEMFRDFAEIAGVELVVIDGTTSASQFGKELRWNQAWYSHGGRP
jgi:L-arabinose isomerase